MKLGDYANIATINSRPTSKFQSNRLEIDFNVTVNKIGFSKQFIDINSIDFYRIMMEEKRNGSLCCNFGIINRVDKCKLTTVQGF